MVLYTKPELLGVSGQKGRWLFEGPTSAKQPPSLAFTPRGPGGRHALTPTLAWSGRRGVHGTRRPVRPADVEPQLHRPTRRQQPRVTSRAPTAPPPVTRPGGRDRNGPRLALLRLAAVLSPRRGKLAGCACVYVGGFALSFILWSRADAAGLAELSGIRRQGPRRSP